MGMTDIQNNPQNNVVENGAVLSGEPLRQARERERYKVIHAVLGLAFGLLWPLVMVLSGASVHLRDLLGGGNTIWSKLGFIASFFVVMLVLEFPLDIFFDYALGKRYGMLKQNFAGWFLDALKNWAVSGLLFGVLLLGLYSIFAALPNLWFVASMLLIALFFVLVLFLSPRLARLNNKSAPLNNPELEQRVKNVFNMAGVKLSKVSRLMVGEKTKAMNAALSPDGTGTEVLMTDTLIENLGLDGVEVVLAHELGHKVHKDLPKLMALGMAQFAVSLLVAKILFDVFTNQFGLRGAADIATLPLLMLCFGVVGTLWGLVTNAVKRQAEYAADNYALQLTRNPIAFENSFRILARENLADPDPPAWVEFWLHDHPSIEKRIRAARTWAKVNT